MNKSLILILLLLVSSISSADHQDPVANTQVNVQTDLFERSVEDWNGFESRLTLDKSDTSSFQSKKGLDDITPESESSINSNASSLSSIRASELEDRGRAKLLEENLTNEIFVDETSPLQIQNQKDAELIANATDALMNQLIGVLKEHFDVDCKSEKGPIEIEPQYYIDLKKEQSKNTVYNKTICEELRNQYSCHDTLTVKCTKRGMKWDPFQYKVIRIPGDVIYHSARDLGYAVHWKKKRNGWHLYQNHQGWRAYLASYLKVKLEQIGEQITFPYGNRGVGDSTHPVYDQWRIVFDEYEFGYHFRTGTEICEAFEETWSETCTLN